MGIIPLYIGWDESGEIYIASEMKSIEPYCEKLQEFPTGNYYKNGEFKFDKSFIVISNRYNWAHGGAPVGYFSVKCLSKIFNYLTF